MKNYFNLAVGGLRYLKSKVTLRNIFGASAAAVTVAPQATGEFAGSRVTGFFNGLARGIGKGMLENPVAMATGLAALGLVGSKVWNKLTR